MKTVKPSPITLIVCSSAMILSIGATIVSLIEGIGFSAASIVVDLLVIGGFVYFLLKYCAQEKIYFDENTFTVGGNDYSYGEITSVTVDSEQILRNVSTLRLTLYIGEDEICSFTKSDKGGKEFIAVMKKHGVSVSIDV